MNWTGPPANALVEMAMGIVVGVHPRAISACAICHGRPCESSHTLHGRSRVPYVWVAHVLCACITRRMLHRLPFRFGPRILHVFCTSIVVPSPLNGLSSFAHPVTASNAPMANQPSIALDAATTPCMQSVYCLTISREERSPFIDAASACNGQSRRRPVSACWWCLSKGALPKMPLAYASRAHRPAFYDSYRSRLKLGIFELTELVNWPFSLNFCACKGMWKGKEGRRRLDRLMPRHH
jgi:hypothetical protein